MAGPAIAQDEMPNPGACAAIGADVERLACYDSAFRRPPPDPELADAEALDARASRQARDDRADEERAPLPRRERARLAFSDLFRDEGAESGRDRIANAGRGGLLDSRWELAKDSKLGVFNFRAYKPVYLLPAFWNNNTNPTPRSSDPGGEPVASQPVDALEAKFQISFKTKALENLIGDNGDVWMGYTQSSRWQVYNTEASRPFRETNY
ncbi:MAG: phospholipase A, partial [Lysobacter spongiicola]|nr:phospholipase A [Lysobacter spongiicola]